MWSVQDYLADHLSIEDERETVSCIPSSLTLSGTQDDSCGDHKSQTTFGRGDVMFGVAFNPAGQPKMTSLSTITSLPTRTKVGEIQCCLLQSCLHPPPPPTGQLTVQPILFLPPKPLLENQQKSHHNVHLQRCCPTCVSVHPTGFEWTICRIR